ncbi:DUF1861 family protein [Clostridioides sp. ES-S-0108-01]|uniref:MTP-1 family protein n=1 Tax=Clostridioides sp. ES-S-0108-01 TaxID=2770773 RepID=UPI001D0CA4F6|nr:DUF1861 family protein [Clostridioides sp. ES-S-0108-01]UDN50168.1 DUF1861 family protein [Clostridioides sp. ES-S-0107-01]
MSTLKTIEQLLNEYNAKDIKFYVKEKIVFENVGEKDVYNISAPFMDENELVIAGRVEFRDSEHSEIHFFVKRNGKWIQRENTKKFTLQDPFFTFINGELILGGVEIFPHPTIENSLGWRTVFYKGKDINSLEECFKGPDGMKDLRLVELKDKKIGVLTRPQGSKGGRGKIGFTIVNKIEDLTVDVIEDAPLLENQFTDLEWGGANEAHLLKDGRIGVLGHIACFDDNGGRHYYPMVFILNPVTNETTDIQLIATRKDFLEGPSKRPDLVDVVFSGGLVRHNDKTATLYAGISDADAQLITIVDPFNGYIDTKPSI